MYTSLYRRSFLGSIFLLICCNSTPKKEMVKQQPMEPVVATSTTKNTNTAEEKTTITTDTKEPEDNKQTKIRPTQVLLVLTKGWNDSSGFLFGYTNYNGQFEQEIPKTPIIVGRRGLAWGIGEHPPQNGTIKKEGDGRAPAGIFSLGYAFGYEKTANTKLQYVQMNKDWYCVDDAKDSHYNTLLSWPKEKGLIPWKSAEKMRRSDSLYELGIVVNHNDVNTKKSKPMGGSCIFLHLWSSEKGKTAGCTAMSKASMHTLLEWLDPEYETKFVQLPHFEYKRLQEQWSLPLIDDEEVFTP